MSLPSTFPFFQKIMQNMHLNTYLLQEPFDRSISFDAGMRNLLNPNVNYASYFLGLSRLSPEHVIYKIFDAFLFNYLLIALPEQESKTFLLIGPYTLTAFDRNTILEKAEEFSVSPELFPEFNRIYSTLPLVVDSGTLFTIVNTFCSEIWGSMDNFTMQEIHNIGTDNTLPVTNYDSLKDADDLFNNIADIEKRYTSESNMLQAVSHGQLHKLEMFIEHLNFRTLEQRTADPIRDAKNYAIVTNTLLRKAAEHGAVHPIHIDEMSSQFAKKIELATSLQALTALTKEMMRKYAMLVKNHSMKGYSPLVRKVMIHIDSDLSTDLSLNAHAKLLNVNPSYLSTVFKKETGCTLTEYVTQKRIDHALFLLNTTSLQVQTIAQYCGFPDIAYFSRTFKRLIGKTPSEYRNGIL